MPQSGSKSCVLYFEPLDKTIKLFNMIEPGSPANQQTYGIQLKSTTKNKSNRTLIGNQAKTADDYLKLPSKNSDWTFDPSRYEDQQHISHPHKLYLCLLNPPYSFYSYPHHQMISHHNFYT